MSWRRALTAAADVAGIFVPGVAAAARVVNAVLGPADQLDPQQATGSDVLAAIGRVPAEQRAALELQLEQTLAQESVDKLSAMVSVETATANTRPEIANRMSWVIALGVGGTVVAILIATFRGDVESLREISGAWGLMGAVLGVPAAVVRAYFGDRSKDKRARYAASQGQHIGEAVGGVVQTIMQAVRR